MWVLGHGPQESTRFHGRLRRYQLIYACGASTQLPALSQRAAAIQALLHTLDALAQPGGARAQLLPERAFVREPPAGASPGAFCGLRLLPGPELSAGLEQLCAHLAEAVLMEPPKYELNLTLGAWSAEEKVGHARLQTHSSSLPVAVDVAH
jgi:hypothetical protein